jgi:putative ABC transport system substrate-binding protein
MFDVHSHPTKSLLQGPGVGRQRSQAGSRGQEKSLPVVGFLHPGSREAYAYAAGAFERGLAESGYAVGQNVLVEYRWTETQNGLLPALAMELAQRQVDVIAALGTVEAARAQKTQPGRRRSCSQ